MEVHEKVGSRQIQKATNFLNKNAMHKFIGEPSVAVLARRLALYNVNNIEQALGVPMDELGQIQVDFWEKVRKHIEKACEEMPDANAYKPDPANPETLKP